jgi:predicted dehydrogenase
MKLRIGIAGAGYAGGVHAENLRRDPRVEVCGIFDPDPARRGGIPIGSFRELLDCSDAIYITAPNTRHVDLALEAVAAGKHVFCEKPLATTLEDARRVLDAASSARTVFQV